MIHQTHIKITQDAFHKISTYVKEHFGINLSTAKLHLVENRLQKRIRQLDIPSFDAYARHIFSSQGREELGLLCDFLSTNKTFFYREKSHFEFLEKLMSEHYNGKPVSIWSAACSAGDEAYTISAVLENLKQLKPQINYSVLGTDISSKMIAEAIKGEYQQARVSELPGYLLKTYFDSVFNEAAKQYIFNTKPVIRQHLTFRKFNLLKDIPLLRQQFDVIFCRNVLIYFEDKTKRDVVDQLIKKLKPGGHLILGHCEGMLGTPTILNQVQPSVFKKPL